MLNRLADRVRLRTQNGASAMHRGPAAQGVITRELAVGETVEGHVESVQDDGIAKVLIEHRPYMLRLPVDVKAGYTLQLTVSERDPVLRFTLNEKPQTPDPDTRLSEAARFITALLAESEKLPVTRAATTGIPLLPNPPRDGAEMANALQHAFTESGMFYEAHQAEWLAGDRPLASLMREPQAQLSPTGLGITGELAHAGAATDPIADELPVHRDALPVVRQQLETLESRQIVWRGLIWNDQPLEWQISQPSTGGWSREDDPAWHAHLVLNMPRLGTLRATLLINNHGTSISIRPTLSETVTEIASHRKILVQALQASGIHPVTVSIDIDEIR